MHAMTGEQPESMGQHELHGESLLPLTAGETTWSRKVHYGEYHGDWYGHYSARMVTDGTWKLVWNLSDLCELYDLENDPQELVNCFYDPACNEIRDHYFQLLTQEAERTGDRHVALRDPAVENESVLPT